MDSRLHTQRSRNRARLPRAFSPGQYAQQQHLPPPPPAPYQVQHRLPLVGEQFTGRPMDHDYATMLAYRQRVNGLLSSQPHPHPHPHLSAGMVSHVTRNQNAAWSQVQERIHSTDNRLDDYNRQGAGFGREYRVIRDDLQSLSELDSSRRSAALSAKLFLDDVRTGGPVFRRETPFESTLPIELNRQHHIERQGISNDLLLAKASQQIPRKRNREEDLDMDRDRVARHRRYHDPGLAVLPRTPEVSRDYPIVQRMLSSGRCVESENPHDSHIIPNRSMCSNERFLTSPSKSNKRRPSMPHRKTLPLNNSHLSPGNAPCSGTRLDEAKEKSIGVKDSSDVHSLIRELHLFEGGARDNRHSSSSPSASHFEKNIGAGIAGDKRSNSFENAKASKVHRNSSARRARTVETLVKGQEAGSQSSKHRSLTSIRKALRAVEATPRNKNLKSRVIRLLGSDAKVCGTSPKSRQGGRGDKRELVPEQTTAKQYASPSFKQAIEHDKGISEQKESKESLSGMKIKQEQSAPTDLESNRAPQHVQSPELSISLPQTQCDLSADCRIKGLKENNASTPLNLLQLGLEKQQTHVSSKSGLPHSKQDEAISPQWHAATEVSGLSAGSQSSTRQMSHRYGLAEKEQSMASSLLSLNVNSDADDLGRKTVKDQVSATPNSSVSLNSQLLKPVLPSLPDACPASARPYNSLGIQRTQSPSSSLFQVYNSDAPVSVMVKFAGETCAENRAALLEVQKIFSNAKVSVIDTNETTAECEVRLFGKSLKAPVAKVNSDSAGSSTSLCLSLDRVEKLGLSTSQLACEQEGPPAGLCTKSIIADVDALSNSMPFVASKWGEAMSGSEKGGGKTITVPPHGMTTHPASPMLDVVVEKQATSHSSPNKLYETEVCTLYGPASEPVCVSPVQDVLEAASDAALNIGAQSAITFPDPASDQEGDASGSQTTDACMHMHIQEQQRDVLGPRAFDACADILKPTSMLDLVPEQQVCYDARQGVPPKHSAPEEDSCQAEAGFKHGGKLEAFSLDKPVNYALSKQVTVATLHPHKKLQNMSVRAVANTWRRSSGNNGLSSSLAVLKGPKPLVNKHPFKFVNQKVSEAAAYVRKGNSLVRAPISTVTGISPLSNTGALGIGKDVLKKEVTAPCVNQGFKNAGKNTRFAFRQTVSAQKMVANEVPSRAPIHDKLSASNVECPRSGQNAGPSQVGVKSVFSEEQLHSSAKTMGAGELVSRITGLEGSDSEPNATFQPRHVPPCVQLEQLGSSGSKMSEITSTFYVKSKANQLVAASPAKTSQVTSSHLSSNDLYYKRNNNQLLRNGSLQKKQAVQVQKLREESHAIWHSTVKKAFRKRAYLPSSRVWTLKDGPPSQVKSVLPLFFPWKRPGRGVSFCAGRFKALPKAKKGSLLFLISKKLQRLRKVQPVYSRSAGGFSLHRSGLLSLSGANLKWTKSIEKRSKLASEEATKAVAEVEKQRRKEKEAVTVANNAVSKAKPHRQVAREAAHERVRVVTIGLARYKMDPLGCTLHRLPDQWSGSTDVKRSTDSAILSTPRRLSFDGTEYVRVGNGHQLVRDPKAASRALANEKVRWSLHTVRSRHAKRQQYCLFYTRFGKCNKSEGDCPYIHDAEKIAVCTKFLKGTCLGINCLFSHKVIPERMPDCSFYLEGMCTNEDCPYRHVSVNPKAPICEGFLKGFCSEGDECNKKHTTVCPTFSATGECPDKSVCKLHHPKKNGKRVSQSNVCKPKAKRRRRYFGIETTTFGGGPTGEFCAEEEAFVTFSSADDSSTMEFIEIGHIVDDDVNENDDFQKRLAFIKQHLPILPTNALQDDADMLIKPLLLLPTMPVPA